MRHAEDGDVFLTCHDTRAEGRRGAVAYRKHRVLRVVDVIRQMMFDTSSLHHARCRDDDAWFLALVQCLTLRHIGDVYQAVEAKRIVVVTQHLSHVLVKLVEVHLKDGCGVGRQRTVDINRNPRQLACIIEIIQDIDNLLRPADGKRRNDELAFFLYASVVDDLQEFLFCAFPLLMKSVAVGALSDDIVALRKGVRRLQQIAVVTPDVTCISYLGDMSVLVNSDSGAGTAKHVACVVKLHRDVVVDIKTSVCFCGDEQLHTLASVFLGVDRLHRLQALTRAFLVKPMGIILLNKTAVWKHYRTQLACGMCAYHRATETHLIKIRYKTRMVDMGMRQDDAVYL